MVLVLNSHCALQHDIVSLDLFFYLFYYIG